MTEHTKTVFEMLLGPEFRKLAAPLREFHGSQSLLHLHSSFYVRLGDNPLIRLFLHYFGVSINRDEVPMDLVIQRKNGREMWSRQIGNLRFRTTLQVQDSKLVEKWGPLRFEFEIKVIDKALFFLHKKTLLGFLELPRSILFTIFSKESAVKNGFIIRVLLKSTILGKILEYGGKVSL